MEIEKRTILEYILKLKDSKLNPNYSRMVNVFIAQILGIIIGLLFFKDLVMLTVMMPMIMAMFINMPLPRKILTFHALIFIVTGTCAVFTACIGTINPLLSIVFFIFWLIFFTLMCFKDMLKQNIGLFTIFIYFMTIFLILGDYLTKATSIQSLISLSAYVSFVSLISLCIGAIPTLLILYLKHDPVKNFLLSSLFTSIDLDTIQDKSALILLVDKTPITLGLIESSIRLMTYKLNLSHIINEANNNYITKVQNEIITIQEYISKNIKENNKEKIEINLKQLEKINTEINTEEKIELINLKKITNLYIEEYERINQIIKGKIIKEIPEINIEKPKETINLENINIRYIIRFITATAISFIFDIFIGNTSQYSGTITSFMAMNPKSNLTENKVIKRLTATILGVSASILIGIILIHFHLSSLFLIFIILGFALFYMFLLENYTIAVFFSCFAFILMKGENLFISQGVYRLISCAFACIISFLIAKYLLPNEEKTNIKTLILEKLNNTTKLIKTLPGEDKKTTLKLIRVNHKYNTNINSSIERIKENYKNADESLELILNFNESLKQIQFDTINLNTYISKYKKDIPNEKLMESVNTYLLKLDTIIRENKKIDLNENLETIKKNIASFEESLNLEEDKISLRLTKWLIEDFEVTYNIVLNGIDTCAFEKLNKTL